MIGIVGFFITIIIALVFGAFARSAIKTGHMNVGVLPAYQFSRTEKAGGFWAFTALFAASSALFTFLAIYNLIRL